MGVVVADYPVIQSPAACVKCGSVDITNPYHGRRTQLWIATCRDCRFTMHSRESFTVESKRPQLTRPTAPSLKPVAGFDILRSLASSALNALNQRDPKLRQMRDIGEEG